MIQQNVNTSNGTVSYWISQTNSQSSKTLFFLHGLTADHTMFDKQVEYFNSKYNLILWDAPAHGKSRPYRDFSLPNAVEDMKRILNANNIKKVVLIGQSLGGYFSQSFLKRYPEYVEAFIAIDTTPYGERYYSKSDKWWLRQLEWMVKPFSKKVLEKTIAHQNTYTKFGFDNMMSMLKQYSKKELCHLMGIGYASFLEDNSDMDIQCPVLLLLGEKDKTGKVPQYNKEWAKTTGYELKFISNAAHNSNVDNYQEVNELIECFLKKNI